VAGSVLVDAENSNAGSLDSAALRFGMASGVGILSNRNNSVLANGLEFWTNNTRRMAISSAGQVGINTAFPAYTLDVSGSIRGTGNIFAQGNAYISNDAIVYGSLGIAMSPVSGYKMAVSGSARYYNNVGIDGTLRTDKKFTNQGKGNVISNSSTTLRSGFTSGTLSLSLSPGASTDVTFIVTSFAGNNSNIRVRVSQFAPGSGAANWGSLLMTPHSVLASDPNNGNASTVKIRFQNTSNSTADLGTNAVLYLYSIVTHVDAL